MSATARQKQGTLKAANFEIDSHLEATAITEEDLRKGLYRGAKVTEYAVDWQHPWAGPVVTNTYFIESTQWDGEQWSANISSLAANFKRMFGRVYARTCSYNIGDSLCTFDIESDRVTGTVDTVSNPLFSFTPTVILSTTDGWFAFGKLLWLTGVNAGVEVEVHTYESTPSISLRLSMPNPIQVGDTFSMLPGCDKTITQCGSKFDNVINFGGFPHIPGNDKLVEGPGKGRDADSSS